MKVFRFVSIALLFAFATSAPASTPQQYAPGSLTASCNAVTSAVGLCTPLALAGNSLAIGVTWQISYNSGTASAIDVTLVGSNDNVNWSAALDTNTSCLTTGNPACSRSLTVTSYKYLACNVGTYTVGSTTNMSCSLTVNPNGGTALGVHGTITPGDCTSWFNSATLQDAGAPCGSGGGTIATTPNVLKGDNAGNAVASSVMDDGTDATQTPNGTDTSAKGVNHSIPNSSAGTVLNETVCRDSSANAVVCPTTTTSGMEGGATTGVGTAPGTTGSVSVCATTGCLFKFDGQTTVGHWSIPSTTTGGYLHDNGSTSQTVGIQSWYITSANSGSGTTATVDVLSGNVASGGSSGGGNPSGTNVQINGSLSHPIANFNGTTPAAPGGNTNVIFQTSTTGQTTSVSGYVPTPSGGITTINMPTSVFAGTPCASPTCTFTFNGQTAGYIWQSPSSAAQQLYAVQSNTCNFTSVGTSTTCSFNSGVNAGDGLMVFACTTNTNPTTASDVQDGSFNYHSLLVGQGCGVWTMPNVIGGSTTVTIGATGPMANGHVALVEFYGMATASEYDTAGSVSNARCVAGFPIIFNPVTTSNNNELVVGVAFDTNPSSPNTAYAGAGSFVLNFGSSGGSAGGIGGASYNAATAGPYTPAMTMNPAYCVSGSGDNQATAAFALKSAGSPPSNAPIFGPINQQILNAGSLRFPQILYSATVPSQTAAISDTTMLTAPVSQLYSFLGTINCTGTSSAASATLNLKYTDTGNTAQTVSATDTCTSLTTSGVPNINVALRAESGTAITWGVTIANTPTYDVDVRLESH